MKDIRLYIAGKLVDCSEYPSFPMTYQLEDFNNPTLVKNGYSKTISIPGTKNNNKLFGEIYKLDRMQHYDDWYTNLSGIDFDPSKRVDFQIFKNADLIESGYMQLNDISIFGNNITYNITLYSGLGDFFYGLKYNEDGTAKTLADLRYFIKYGDTLLDAKTEMDFNITKDLVFYCFSRDWDTVVDRDQLEDFLTFIPSYNGEYEDFDSSHCLVNTNHWDTFPLSKEFPKSVTVDGKTFTTVNGFGLASLNKSYTEWEMRDLRSYHQRPALKVSKLIETICREENSGYKVTFDPSFFNDNNPYWSKTFLALPLLNSDMLGDSSSQLSSVGQLGTESFWFGNKNGTERKTSDGLITISGDGITVGSDGVVDLSGVGTDTTLNLSIDFQLFAECNAPDSLLYGYYYKDQHTMVDQIWTVYLSVVDADTDEELGYSSAYQFQTHKITYNGKPLVLPVANGTYVNVIYGKFKKDNNRYFFESDNGGNTWNLKLNDCKKTSRVKILLRTEVTPYSLSEITPEYKLTPIKGSTVAYDYWGYTAIQSASGSLTTGSRVTSGQRFTKQTLLKTEETPADFLLDYAKIFGLYFIKDVGSKSIFICNRNTFFTGNVVDWSDRIDYSKDITVTPILFDKKYYLMALDTPESRFANKYQSQYSQSYGQQRLSTGYNFNYDSTNFYEDNLYQQVVPALDADKYFRTFYDLDGNEIPAWLNDNAGWTLYNGDESNESDIYGANFVNSSATVEWSTLGRDMWAKSAFFTLDGDTKNLEDISSALLMWNGLKLTQDSEGHSVPFWVTDDLDEMITLNDGEPCYIYTQYGSAEDGSNIGLVAYILPQYLNCRIDSSNNVTNSLDFGLPKEVYMGNVAYSENATVYYNFWRNFYNDQFNINTKKVTCFVKLDRMNQEYLRDFYFFDNAIWILNKVDSYDVSSDATVRCEFCKVQSMDNYTNGQTTF